MNDEPAFKTWSFPRMSSLSCIVINLAMLAYVLPWWQWERGQQLLSTRPLPLPVLSYPNLWFSSSFAWPRLALESATSSLIIQMRNLRPATKRGLCQSHQQVPGVGSESSCAQVTVFFMEAQPGEGLEKPLLWCVPWQRCSLGDPWGYESPLSGLHPSWSLV